MSRAEHANSASAGPWTARLRRALVVIGRKLRAANAYRPEDHYMRGPGPASREARKRPLTSGDGEPA